jgi:hypothetical protein
MTNASTNAPTNAPTNASTNASHSLSAAPKQRSSARVSLFKRLLIILGILAVFLVLLRPFVNDPPQKGPEGSSFGTVGGGVAALADLAKSYNYPYARRLTSLDDASRFGKHPLDPKSVLVILDTTVSSDAAANIDAFVSSGGRLVASIDSTSHWTASIVGVAKAFTRETTDGKPTNAGAALATNTSIGTLTVAGGSGFDAALFPELPAGKVSAVANRNDKPIAVQAPIGDGVVILLADASMLTNQLLGETDNAAFALELLGNGTRPIVFAEEPHGFGASLTPTGLPANVRWFLIGLIVAALLWMITRSKRNGPPELAHRELAPARSVYLLSLVASIDRSEKKSQRMLSRNKPVPDLSPDLSPETKD